MDHGTSEHWLVIPGWEGFYEVSDLGRVRSMDRTLLVTIGQGGTYMTRRRGQILRQTPGTKGYLGVHLNNAPHRRCRKETHTLVLAAFAGPLPDGVERLHSNGNQTDNRLTNLRYGTHAENMADILRHGRNRRAAQVECKWGHLLTSPNLRPSSRSHRQCRACHRACASKKKAEVQGAPFDFQENSDWHYARIVAGITERPPHWRHSLRVCDNGHDLTLPGARKTDSTGGNRCVECRRMSVRRYDMKRRSQHPQISR